MACCDVTPTCLRNLRIDMLKSSDMCFSVWGLRNAARAVKLPNMRMLLMILIVVLLPIGAWANERLVHLYVPDALVETGLMRHILPRFTLKTQVRVELVATVGGADMVWGDSGRAIFVQGGSIWHMAFGEDAHSGVQRFAQWLSGDVGQRTILGFAPNGEVLFLAAKQVVQTVAEIAYDGDPETGYKAAKTKCGRCHAVDEGGRKNDIGSTPSFFVLKVFDDWEDRFTSFYVLRPHGSFTQIKDVTAPFAPNMPPPIKPIEMTLEELEDILAYVATLQAADLGKKLVHQ